MKYDNDRVSRMKFTHGGKKYRTEGRIVRTPYGFENEVKIFDEHDNLVATIEEPANDRQCVQWFIEGLETEVPDEPCSACGGVFCLGDCPQMTHDPDVSPCGEASTCKDACHCRGRCE